MAGQVLRHRRYCLLKYFEAVDLHASELWLTWLAKKRAQPGTALPDDFPSRTALLAAQYEVLEEVDGADERELMSRAQLSGSAALAAIAAASAALA